MRFLRPLLGTVLTSLFLTAPLTGCPDDEICEDYTPPATFDAQTPAVSFSRDVMPIFSQSCAFTTCHGSTATTNGVYLGGTDALTIHNAVVDVRSSKLQSMSYVKPGDPRESFLMRKMDGSHCVLDAQCSNADCGDSMPQNEDKLPLATRDVVRRWIAQGAKND